MEESKEKEKSNKLSELKKKLASISVSLESDIKDMEQQKKKMMKY